MKVPLKQIFKIHISILVFIILFSNCKKKEQFPIIPFIEFKDFLIQKSNTGIDSSVLIIFSFKDGDGDIGYPDEDSLNMSVFVYYYKKKDGAYYLRINPEDPPSQNFNVKLPMLLNSGVKRPIKGDIEYSLDISKDPPIYKYDTIYLEFYMMDRALNKSNLISTPEIVLRRKL